MAPISASATGLPALVVAALSGGAVYPAPGYGRRKSCGSHGQPWGVNTSIRHHVGRHGRCRAVRCARGSRGSHHGSGHGPACGFRPGRGPGGSHRKGQHRGGRGGGGDGGDSVRNRRDGHPHTRCPRQVGQAVCQTLPSDAVMARCSARQGSPPACTKRWFTSSSMPTYASVPWRRRSNDDKPSPCPL